jgi:hypothetical protein
MSARRRRPLPAGGNDGPGLPLFTNRQLARAARGTVENALDRVGQPWPWRRGVSLWIDCLVIIEEQGGPR